MKRPYLIGFGLAIFALVLYMLTLSRHYTADSILFAEAIESDYWLWLVDPTHPLLHPLGWVWFQLWKLLGWSGGAILPLQTLNAIGGALCVGLFFLIFHGISKSLIQALLISAGFAVSGGLWLLSVEAEFVTIPMAMMLLFFLTFLLYFVHNDGQNRHIVILGIIGAIAVLTYLSAILMILVVGFGLWLQKHGDKRTFLHQSLLYLSVVFIIVIPVTALMIYLFTGGNWSDLPGFYSNSDYGQPGLLRIPQGLFAFFRTLALFPGLAMNDSTLDLWTQSTNSKRIIFILYYAVVALFATVPFIVFWKRRKSLRSEFGPLTILTLLWLALFGMFAIYWVPGDISFWLPVLAAWWLFLGLMVSSFIGGENITADGLKPTVSSFRAYKPLGALATVIFLLIIVNSTLLIFPRKKLSTNIQYQQALHISAQTSPSDLIIIDDGDILSLYTSYFGQRNVLALDNISAFEGKITAIDPKILHQVNQSGGQILLVKDDQLILLNN